MRGFVPTPESLVDHMVNLLFEGQVIDSEDRLLDPGCGAGAFMEGLLRWSSASRSRLPQMTGMEIDGPLAAQAACQFRYHECVSVVQDDFLRSEHIGKYQYIIGNPPYVSILGLDEREKTEYRSMYRAATGRFDLYMLFFERAIDALEPGGRMVFVTPEKFTYVDSASALRELLGDCDVRRLELLPEDSFGDLVTYPLVTVVEKIKTYGMTRIVDRAGFEKSVRLPRDGVSWGPLLNGSSSGGPEAGDMTDVLSAVCERVSCGVATGADGVFVFERDELPTEFARFAWPTVAGRDLVTSSARIETHSVMVVPYTDDGNLMPFENLGSFGDYLMDPQISARLLERSCVKRKPWYAFHETPHMSRILRPKILCKDIARRPTFWIDKSGATVPRHSTYYIVPTDESILDPLCEYLNGKRAHDWLVENCQRAANGFIRTQSNVLKRLPIPSELVKDEWRRPGLQLRTPNGGARPAVLEQVV